MEFAGHLDWLSGCGILSIAYYQDCPARIGLGGHPTPVQMTGWFETKDGVRQGSVLSPVFSCFVHCYLEML